MMYHVVWLVFVSNQNKGNYDTHMGMVSSNVMQWRYFIYNDRDIYLAVEMAAEGRDKVMSTQTM